MYGIFTYIYPKNQPNVGKYTIHGSYGNGRSNQNSRHTEYIVIQIAHGSLRSRSCDTVDGRNPAQPEMYKTLKIMG